MQNKKIIILDTNFLLIPFNLRIDIFQEISKIIDFPIEFAVLEQTIAELKKIIEKKAEKEKNKKAAQLALKLIELKNKKKEIKIVNFLKDKQKTLYKDTNSKNIGIEYSIKDTAKGIKKDNVEINNIEKNNVDEIILSILERHKYIVATQDLSLRKKLLKKGIRTIYLRNKKKMEMQNVL